MFTLSPYTLMVKEHIIYLLTIIITMWPLIQNNNIQALPAAEIDDVNVSWLHNDIV